VAADERRAAERPVRELRAAGRLADAAALRGNSARSEWPAGQMAPRRSAPPSWRHTPPCSPLQVFSLPPAAKWRDTAADQRSFAAAATSGGERTARMAEADRIDAWQSRR